MASCHRLVSVAFCATLTASCALRPDIEDSTGFRATDIVRKVRCETREAMTDKLAAYLQVVTGDPYGQQIYPLLQSDGMSIRQVDVSKFTPDVAALVTYFLETGLAYDFTLNMTEKNDADASIDLLNTISGGTLSALTEAGIRRTRNNVQTFTVTDTFRTLAYVVEDGYCAIDKEQPGYFNTYPNYVYPIAGRIGVARMVDEFVDLALFGSLSDSDPKTPAGAGPPTMANALEFTTHFYGNLTPVAVVEPNLTKGSISFKNSREDKHRIIVGFAARAPRPVPVTPPAEPTFIVAAPTNAAQRLAVDAVDKFIGRTEFGRSTIVIDGQTIR